MGSSREASLSTSLQEGASLSSPKGGGRRGAGRQVVPLADALATKSLNYKLEREALLAAPESVGAIDFRHDYALPLKMTTTPGISSLPTIPSMAADAVAVNCFKGLRRSRKATKSPKGVSIPEEEEREGEKPASLRQRRVKKLDYKVESDEDYHYIEPEETRPRAKGSRRGKVVAETLQIDLDRQGVRSSFEQETSGTKNPCNTPNVSPPTRPAQLAREVTNAFLEEPVRVDKSTTGVRMEQQARERQNGVDSASVDDVSVASLEGSRSSRMALDREQANFAEHVDEAPRLSRRRARAEQAVQAQGDQSAFSAEARPSVRTSGRKVEPPELDAGNPVEGCLAVRGSVSLRAKHSQHKRKTISDKEALSLEIAEPPARIPKLESQSPMSWQRFSESTHCEESHWVNSIVDVVMWQDVPRSSLFFGMGCFFILSASFMQEMSCGVTTIGAYTALLHLSAVFIYKNFLRRDLPLQPHGSQVTEDDVLNFIRFLMPSISFFSRKTSQMFSGNPSTTLKLTVALWLLAQAGYFMSFWTLGRIVFFAMFIIPRCYSSYSLQLQGQARSIFSRLFQTWRSCSHKKLVLVATFLSAWNLSSFPARLCGAFILLVGFRLYQQTHNLFRDNTNEVHMEVEEKTLASV